ncbi:MAG: GH1 family beta-glucosidase [Acidimicrobiales bacterium]
MPGNRFSTGDNFYWGAATAAYQIEGSPLADGAGRCVWHEFSHTPSTTHAGETGDVAADHYHRWESDIAIMRGLGLNAYRFSVRWPRVIPDGSGRVNEAGLGFYDRMLDGVLRAGLEPFVTLFHWDMPSALLARGGWSNRDVAEWFADYCATVAGRLGDRVKWWTTLNEPFVVAEQGHLVGAHAPGMRNIFATGQAVHNQLRAHVAGRDALKAVNQDASVGIALHNAAVWPATDAEADQTAAETANAWHSFPLFLEPLVFGRYPQELEERLSPYLPQGYERDMDALQVPPDFVGLNYYHGYRARHDVGSWLGYAPVEEPDAPQTTMNWAIRPEGLRRILSQAHERYKLPSLLVTENGASFADRRDGDAVHDQDRTAYLKSHIAEVLRARDEGVPVHGYFVWSLLDNFEWALGYSKRFGIVYVDYGTQERVIKDSGHWYGSFVREQLSGGGAVRP